ncbi:MAG: hypothetical protein ACE5HK_02510 [Candidatus Methylomirabilales bacterium]
MEDVETDLDKAQTAFRVKHGEALDVARLRQVVVKAGFTLTWIRIEAVGRLVKREGTYGFQVAGVDQVIPLTESVKLHRLRQEAEGRTAAIVAVIPERHVLAELEAFTIR